MQMLASLQQLRTCEGLCARLPHTNRLPWRHNGYSLPAKHYSSTTQLPKKQKYHGWINRKNRDSRFELALEASSRECQQSPTNGLKKLDNTDPKLTIKKTIASTTGTNTLTLKSTPREVFRLRNARETNETRDDSWDSFAGFIKTGSTILRCISKEGQQRSNVELAASTTPLRIRAKRKEEATSNRKKNGLNVIPQLIELLPFLDKSTASINDSYSIDGQDLDQVALRKVIRELTGLRRAKLKYNQFYRRLLSWQYEDFSEYPPGFDKSKLQKTLATYADCDTYVRVFEPLLVLEAWSRIQNAKIRAKDNSTGQAQFMYSRTQGEFRYIVFAISLEDANLVKENDIVVIAEALPVGDHAITGGERKNGQQTDGVLVRKRFSGRKTFFALVKGLSIDRTHVQMDVRVYFDDSQAKSLLGRLLPGSRWEFCSIYALTTAQREYSALQSMENMDKDLVKEILRPHTSLCRPEPSRAEVQRVMATYGLNQSQAEAIASATKRKHGFSLIQGPPGTGKTKAILCLACELLSASKASTDSGEGEKNNPGPTANSKLLICAHSNAAVDEIAKRLRNGIRDKSGATFYPRVVRLGRSDHMSSTVKDISLEVLAGKALLGSLESKSAAEEERRINDQQRSILPGGRGQNQKGLRVSVSTIKSVGEKKREVETSINLLYDELKKISIEISELYADKARVVSNDASAVRSWKDKLQMAKQKRSNIAQEQAYMLIQKSEYIRESGLWTNDSPINMARKKILEEADIICSTLVGSGHDRAALLDLPFETVIIDEAAQSTEPMCLIPLRYGCKRCILVGDPNQLPPTVTSKHALENLYSQSLFERIQKLEPQAVSALNIQYRMHPEISVFPSQQFYESRLLDGPDMAANRHAPWHDNIKYRPFQFFDIYSGKEQIVPSNSVYNMAEVAAAVQLVYNLCTDYPDLPWKQRIGVITTYNVQLEKLIEQFKIYFGDTITEAIEFNTVDGFQGQEKDVIIFSCVRAGDSGMGFLQDQHRMNVGLTRARKSLFVLGNADRLIVSPPWKKLIGEARARWLLRKGTLPLFGNPAKRGDIPKGLLRDVNEGSQSAFISKGGQQYRTTLVGSESTATATRAQAGG